MPKCFKILLFLIHFATFGQDDDKVYITVDKQAEVVGGNVEFFKYISQNLNISSIKQPEIVVNLHQSCYQKISFIVEKNGQLTYLPSDRCGSKELEDILRKLIENAPKWEPAMINGKVVRYKTFTSISCILLED